MKALARAQDVTLYMLLLGAWQVLLSRHSGQDDIVVGSPMANRDRPELEGLIGCFVNNVVIRGRLDGNPRFTDFLAAGEGDRATCVRPSRAAVRPSRRGAEARTQHEPYTALPDVVHAPLFPRSRPCGRPGLEVELVQFESGSSRFDLTLDVDEHEGALRMSYEYATDLFDAATIDRMHAQYVTLLRQIASDANQTVRDIPLLTQRTSSCCWRVSMTTACDHDRSRCVHDMVRERRRAIGQRRCGRGVG